MEKIFTLRSQQTDIGPIDTGGKLPPVSLTPAANLPQVSTTLAKLVKNLPPVSLKPVEKLAAGVVANFQKNSKRS
jgi:hypothetical protein